MSHEQENNRTEQRTITHTDEREDPFLVFIWKQKEEDY